MARTVPTTEPAALRAGDTWQWRREDLDDYPASDWTLTYYFRNAASYFDVTAAADGDMFAVDVAATTTADRAAGWYDWTAMVSDGTDRFEVGRGRIEILANVAAAEAHDGRSFARRMLDAIEASLESRASSDQLDMVTAQLESRSLTRDKAGLMTLRDRFKAEVATEDRARRGARSNRILAVC